MDTCREHSGSLGNLAETCRQHSEDLGNLAETCRRHSEGFGSVADAHFRAVMVSEHQYRHDEGKKVGHGHAEPYAVQSVGKGQQGKSRKKEQQLAREGEEDGDFGFPDRLEELGDDNLRTHHGKGGYSEAYRYGGLAGQLVIGGEHSYEHTRKQFADGKAAGGDDNGGGHSQP